MLQVTEAEGGGWVAVPPEGRADVAQLGAAIGLSLRFDPDAAKVRSCLRFCARLGGCLSAEGFRQAASKEGKLTVRSSDPRPDVTIPLRLAMRPLCAPLPSLCVVRARLRVL